MAYLNTERPVLPSPQAPFHGMAASGIVTVISAVALAIILTTNPTAAGSFSQIAAFGTVGGGSLIIFVVCSALACHACRKMKERREEEHLENERLRQEHERQPLELGEQHTASPTQQPVEPLHSVEPPPPDLLPPVEAPRTMKGQPPPELLTGQVEGNHLVAELNEAVVEASQAEGQTIEKLKREIIPPLMDAFRDAVSELLRAHAAITDGAPPDPRAINDLFVEAKSLIMLNLEKPELYLTELLRCFGRGKNKPSVGLRRLIAAHNSGNPDKFEEVRRQYAAIERGHNLHDVAALFRSRTGNSQILDQLPQLMEGHFSLDDVELQGVGRELLDAIFGRLKNNRTIDNALTALRKKAPREGCTKSEMEDFTKEVEKFMKLAFTEAHIPHGELEEMSDRLVEVWIERQLMQNMKKLLGMVARNIRLLPSMFADSVDTRVLFPQIDETFLLSESGDCLGETEEMQKQLIRLQSTINYDRKPENRVAFLVLDEGDTRSYEVLRRENEVVRMCLDANSGNYNLRELERIGKRSDVQDLGRQLQKRILVVPVSITNHPFKDIRNKLNWVPNWAIRGLYGIFSGFIPGLVKPGLAEMLPALEPREQERFDRFVDAMLNLLMQPIYDGSINNSSPFRKQTVRGREGKVERRPFEEVIARQGNALAINLENLVNQKEPITFEQIRDVWVESVGNVAEGFKSLHE